VAVDINQRGTAAQEVIEKEGYSFTFLETHVGENDPVKEHFNIPGVPVNYFINEDGYVVFKKLGFKPGDEAQLEAKVKKYLNP
jgi:hypothetical protein